MNVAISVVVPSRGGAQRLPLLLDLLAAQTLSDWEAVVVVDGDIDDSASVLERYAAFAPVRSIVFPENRGRPAALNAGFEAATGEVVLRCDDDLAPGPAFLAGHVGAHTDGPRGVIGMCRNLFPETAYAASYGRRAYIRQRDAAYAAAPEDTWHYWGGNVSVDRDTWHRVGPYDEAFRSYGWEDVDWGYRLSRLGVPIVVVPALETDHHVAATTTSGRALRAYYSGSARHRFETKHGALAQARGRSFDPWNLAVSATARLMTEHLIETAGGAVDRAAPRLPTRIAEKAIALLVEAGAQAGYRRRVTSRSI